MNKFLCTLICLFFTLNKTYAQDSISQKEIKETHYKEFYIPAGLMLSGILLNGDGEKDIKNQIKDFRNEIIPNFNSKVDDYAQYIPFVMAYTLDFTGMKSQNNLRNKTIILLRGQIINLSTLYILKTTLNETRPNGGSYSFPSGHTANVFAGATFLATEYKEYEWVPYVAYGVASGVGIMRIANNKHYISDVLFGAGLGILSMNLSYKIQDLYKTKQEKIEDPLAYYFNNSFPKELN